MAVSSLHSNYMISEEERINVKTIAFQVRLVAYQASPTKHRMTIRDTDSHYADWLQ